MSEFECRNGHLMKGIICGICGARLWRMDGKTERELRGEEEDIDEYIDTEEEEDV